ncbi:MAG: hypothetical protein A2008_06110 [Candidatus Wallbacteria bacterium GWC2_49_35]|uniref:Uncharacterized protein n=1 Tax=Candidatus Wallbacteria bacterium GWC2_49_35 TaxID=1817813 RepID=A0A1F7WFN5_9BACT|nr:MAG: hypothetical protein A2008_06110 [Candidatus Wallbacteria bacterium GWC2_49_35]HBC75714.1 hypothetical protein [Candidatus Wallbacteria bacterium]
MPYTNYTIKKTFFQFLRAAIYFLLIIFNFWGKVPDGNECFKAKVKLFTVSSRYNLFSIIFVDSGTIPVNDEINDKYFYLFSDKLLILKVFFEF